MPTSVRFIMVNTLLAGTATPQHKQESATMRSGRGRTNRGLASHHLQGMARTKPTPRRFELRQLQPEERADLQHNQTPCENRSYCKTRSESSINTSLCNETRSTARSKQMRTLNTSSSLHLIELEQKRIHAVPVPGRSGSIWRHSTKTVRQTKAHREIEALHRPA